MATVLLSYAGLLASHCTQMCSEPYTTDLGPCRCVFFYNPTGHRNITDGDDVGGFEEGSWTLLTARLIVIFIVLLHFGEFFFQLQTNRTNSFFSVVLSIGFVHRKSLIYKKSPHSNLVWLGTVFVLLVCST